MTSHVRIMKKKKSDNGEGEGILNSLRKCDISYMDSPLGLITKS